MANATEVDLHDLSAILLRERLLTFKQLRKARLLDISVPPTSSDGEKVTAYVVEEEGEGLDEDAITEPSNFIHPNFTSTSPRPNPSETERIYWDPSIDEVTSTPITRKHGRVWKWDRVGREHDGQENG